MLPGCIRTICAVSSCALEVFEQTGRPLSDYQTQWHDPVPGLSAATPGDRVIERVLWLDLPRATLYDRINRRVEGMFAAGLVDEVRTLRNLQLPISREAAQALGYEESSHILTARRPWRRQLARCRRVAATLPNGKLRGFAICRAACPQHRN